MARTDLDKHPHDPFLDLLEWRQFLDGRIQELEAELMMSEGSTATEGRGPSMGDSTGDEGRGDSDRASRRLSMALVEAQQLRAQNAKELMPYFYARLSAAKVDANVDTTLQPGSGPISATSEFIKESLGEGTDPTPAGSGKR